MGRESLCQERKKEIEKKIAECESKTVSDSNLFLLKELVDEDPNIYLDELTLSFGIMKGEHAHQSTVWKHIAEDLGYTLKVLESATRDFCETNETQFRSAIVKMF